MGSKGGNGALAVDGVDGSPGQGGAIYSAGALDVADVRFEDNVVRGGIGGEGGEGGEAGNGGPGGHGGHPHGSGTVGGDGGNAGPPGTATSGGRGGRGGSGQGGAIYAVGSTSIVRAHFARNTAHGGPSGLGGDGGSGAGGQFGLPGRIQIGGAHGNNPDCNLLDGYWYVQCGRPGTSTGGAGADGGPNGEAGDALGGAVFFEGVHPPPLNATNEGNAVVGGSNLAAECASANSWQGCGTGGSGGTSNSITCGHTWSPHNQPPCPRALNGGKGFTGAVGRAENPDIASDQADGLRVVLRYADDLTPGYRFPLGEDVPAQVVVSVADTAPGAIKDIVFDENGVLAEVENDVVDLTVPEPPAKFQLAPGASRTFDVKIKGRTRGTTALRTAVAGKDALGRTAESADREVLKVGHDLQVTLTPTPTELDLEVDRTTDPPTIKPKPVELAVKVENVSGEAVKNARLDLQMAVRSLVGRDPAAPFPLQLEAALGPPETPLTNAAARDLEVGDLAVGASKTLRFRAQAKDKALVDVIGVATGKAGDPERTVTGRAKTEVRIAQPALLLLTASGDRHGAVKAGKRWNFAGHVKNLSPDEDITIFLRTVKRENVAEGQLDMLGDPDACGCGVFRRLEPGERLPVYGSVVASTTTAGTRGYLKMDLSGKRHTYDDQGTAVDVPVGPTQIVIAEGADERTLSIDRTDPPTPDFTLTEAAWLLSDSAARTLGERVTGAWESASAALAYAQSLDMASAMAGLQQVALYVREEVPEAYQAAKDDMVRTLLAFDDQLDSGQALAIADEAFAKATVATRDAYDQMTWQDVATKSGAVLASNGPDLALEAVLPAIAACKLLKRGGKAAMTRRADELARTRPARINQKGRNSLEPGDEISDLLARKLWGVDGVIDSQLLAYAKEKKLMIAVRDRSPGSIRRLAEGMLPKWEAVKAKNVSDLDVQWLGFHKTHLDTAMLKQMPPEADLVRRLNEANVDEDTYFQVLARYDQRKKEWDGKDRMQMEAYERDGVIIKPTAEVGLNPLDNGIPADNVFEDVDYELLRAGKKGDRSGEYLEATTDGLPAYQPRAHHDGKFRAMTGDMDPIAFLDENGQIPSDEVRQDIYRDLAKMGFQHPESLTWKMKDLRLKYLWDFDIRNPLADALLVYHPDGSRRAGFFDSGKSRLDEPDKGFMKIEGTTLKFSAGPPTAGPVPLVLPPATDPPVYLTPGGSAGANLSSTPGTRLIRRNPNGTFSEWTPEGGWQPYELPSGQTLTTLPQTAVRTEVKAGETRIDIAEQAALILAPGAQAWFKPGDLVVIDPGGPNEEFITVEALGSIIAAAALEKDHVPGEMIAVVPQRVAAAAGVDQAATPAPPALGRGPVLPVAPLRPAAPRLSAVKLDARTFRRAKGTKLSLTLDRAAVVTVTLRRELAGRRKGKACSRSARTGKRCTVLAAAGTRRVAGKAGTTSVAFGKGLRRGRYVATVVAERSAPVTLRFTVR
ncbi:MAG: hypothetical protein AVDCRST_MAG85-2320 [uncultured Solirubrobacteraceae bacterium]|uniref:Uncharacterized protein n=1 Tax=uncultured Solirubrobacteraceae bacterium TaxID=1162706 RepID=A0A6J4T0W4_9ACTN|nr:MAG: hypothetical protein AVDCRST_MAG85-2320 [uncultured Solirubrobacteraceae bacterium]